MADHHPYQNDYLTHFFGRLGVRAHIEITEDNGVVFVVDTAAFKQRRSLIEAWFELIEEGDENCRLRERLRGTGKTS